MIKSLLSPLIIAIAFSSCTRQSPDDFVLVKGGKFINNKSSYYKKNLTVPDFLICKHEVTQEEWADVMGSNPSQFRSDNLPVEMVSWYECIEYCNIRSLKEGLHPYYNIDKNKKDTTNNNDLDDLKWTVTINDDANGYRLPTELEWEYAACGGQFSKSYTYSGSNSIDDVAWYWKNAGDNYLTGFWSWGAVQKNNNKEKLVDSKEPNELGIYDMSGNVREWCWDEYDGNETEPPGRIWKGGGWMGAEFCCEPSFRAQLAANAKGPDQGIRVCKGK